jgi:hypothetical protein
MELCSEVPADESRSQAEKERQRESSGGDRDEEVSWATFREIAAKLGSLADSGNHLEYIAGGLTRRVVSGLLQHILCQVACRTVTTPLEGAIAGEAPILMLTRIASLHPAKRPNTSARRTRNTARRHDFESAC